MTKSFANTQKIEVEINGLTGFFTIPIMMTDRDLDKYIEITMKNREWQEAQEEKGNNLAILAVQLQIDNRKHLVKTVDFPGLTIDDFRNKKRPFPVFAHRVITATEPLITDALTAPN